MDKDYTTLLIKLPPELKGSFQGLCKARGVSMNEELRRFMADEVASSATGMTTVDKPKVKKMPRVQKELEKSDDIKNRGSSRCNDTVDMFDDESKADRKKRLISEFNEKQAHNAQKAPKSATKSNLGLSSAIKTSMYK